jgi:molybdopterin molybdotransferase
MISVAEARARILIAVPLMPAETVPLVEAHGRALAEDIVARHAHPPGDVSAMDGYALRAADIVTTPATLKVVGESAAGRAYAGVVGSGEAVRIFTGALLPKGANAIVIQENADTDGQFVRIRTASSPGKHIRRQGFDFAPGDTLLKKGTLLDARALALAAAANHAKLAVRRRPKLALLATGDELVRLGTPLGPSQIVSTNSIALAALVRLAGGETIDLGIAPDRPDAVADAAEGGRGADFLVVSGGISVGAHDVVQKTLAARGLKVDFWRVAIRPGKPLMFGLWDAKPVFGLPGNPVSAVVCGLVFLRAAVRSAQGLDPALPVQAACLGQDLPANHQREDYLRARLETDGEGALWAHPLPKQDSAMLTALAGADALVIRPPGAPAVDRGSRVSVVRLSGLL